MCDDMIEVKWIKCAICGKEQYEIGAAHFTSMKHGDFYTCRQADCFEAGKKKFIEQFKKEGINDRE